MIIRLERTFVIELRACIFFSAWGLHGFPVDGFAAKELRSCEQKWQTHSQKRIKDPLKSKDFDGQFLKRGVIANIFEGLVKTYESVLHFEHCEGGLFVGVSGFILGEIKEFQKNGERKVLWKNARPALPFGFQSCNNEPLLNFDNE